MVLACHSYASLLGCPRWRLGLGLGLRLPRERRKPASMSRRPWTMCCSSEGGNPDEPVFLTPKPTPRPVAPSTGAKDEEQDAYTRRMMSLLEGEEEASNDALVQEQMLDPRRGNFRAEMRKRLLYTDPPPLDDPDEEEQDVEFDLFEHLVLTIRYLLHLRYKVGQRLQLEDELILLEEAIPYHPDRDFKVGCGIDYIKVDTHPEFGSRCFFIVRRDGSEIDFSYRKCMMGLANSRPGINLERARDLVYFFKTTGGQKRPRFFTLI